ncbi:MAG: L-alanine-DL-glutamate epimerase of enolase superfamily, partial [Chthonomonadaceae bacterium]|nr:L-alanine-DL-glutamate epimerase of enolase superfamily [Chthonomonadaceae bacterium]
MDIRIASVSAERLTTPLHNPFVTSQGRATAALAVLVRMTLSDGRVATGESVPVTYVTGETIDTVLAAVERAGPELIGLEVERYRRILDTIARMVPDGASARCGLEMAALDAWAQATGSSMHRLWGAAQDSKPTDVTIPIVENAGELTELAWALGMRVFKIKVGDSSIEADHARVLAVRNAAPEAPLRIDANQAFTPENALRFVERLLAEGAHVQLLEQPVRADDFEGLNWIAERSPVPVFADESCRTPANALRLAQTAVQGFNCKIQKNGIAGVLDIISIARAADRRLMLGCMLETRRSIAVSLALACGTGAFDYLDLDSHLLLNEAGANPYFSQEG